MQRRSTLVSADRQNGLNAGLSAEMAIRCEKAFGHKADTLMMMQSVHELAKARAWEDQIDVAVAAV